jgi:preprotein translocase subunit SecG
MYTAITIIHVLACIFLALVVLLQTGKGADMGAVFGGSSSTVFGSSGAGNFLTRLTTATAIVFMLTSISLTYLSARKTTATVFDSAPVENVPQSAPAEKAPDAPPAPQAAAPAQDAAAPQAPAAAAPQAPAAPEAPAANDAAAQP